MERQIIIWSATLIHSGQYLRVDASLKRQKLYICATNEETNLHKHIRNVEKSTFRPYYMYSAHYLTKTTPIRYRPRPSNLVTMVLQALGALTP